MHSADCRCIYPLRHSPQWMLVRLHFLILDEESRPNLRSSFSRALSSRFHLAIRPTLELVSHPFSHLVEVRQHRVSGLVEHAVAYHRGKHRWHLLVGGNEVGSGEAEVVEVDAIEIERTTMGGWGG